ncbi:DUF418 domain-containing protein [Piscibacillus halophilus]|uniref:DUF418 domain-containing protein n=1 Tax=Piscibacillus halophilus TaxID=571933 RepID=A0A1H9B0M6_9BACI|nr:DUF418 domain-containing protein [Piscibacillus halophilus]SEP82524.1 uncharacterized protein SAMN05216362_103100 [Piscibacillus halophilus]
MQPLNPTNNRIESIDTVRGFSLLGILIVNLLSFHSPHFIYGGLKDFYGNGFDALSLAFIDIFAQASFYPLFSMLFGVGIYMMYEKLEQRGAKTMSIIRRRMLILSIFGLIHGLFIWYGDILLTYGIVGFISLLFLKKTIQSLVKWSFSLLLSVSAILVLLVFPVRNELEEISVNHQGIQAAYDNYTGTLLSALNQNIADWVYSNDPFTWIFSIFTILPMFLLGMMIQKNGWTRDPKASSSSINRWLIGAFTLFVLFKIGPYFFGNPLWFESAQDTIGGSALSVFYFLGALVLFNRRNFHWLKGILSKVGKLSLTNYLMQSLLGIVIFYGFGLNLYGKLHAFTLITLAILLFSVQILFSHWYVKRFRFGPFEWIYRSLTYRQKQPFVKKGD